MARTPDKPDNSKLGKVLGEVKKSQTIVVSLDAATIQKILDALNQRPESLNIATINGLVEFINEKAEQVDLDQHTSNGEIHFSDSIQKQELVGGFDTSLHNHDSRYWSKTQLLLTQGAIINGENIFGLLAKIDEMKGLGIDFSDKIYVKISYGLDFNGSGEIEVISQDNSIEVASGGIRAATPTDADKGIVGILTSLDEDPAGVIISRTPVQRGPNRSPVQVSVNGIIEEVGNGAKDKACYFSRNGGVTAKNWNDIEDGDELYWMGSIAGYQLDADDRISLWYSENT